MRRRKFKQRWEIDFFRRGYDAITKPYVNLQRDARLFEQSSHRQPDALVFFFILDASSLNRAGLKCEAVGLDFCFAQVTDDSLHQFNIGRAMSQQVHVPRWPMWCARP